MQKILQFIPVQLTLFLIVGILIGSNQVIEPKILFGILFCLLTILAVSYYISNKSYKRKFHYNYVVFLISLVIGITTVTIQNELLKESHYSHAIHQKHAIEVKVIEVLKPSLYHHKYVVTVLKLDGKTVSGSVLLNISKDGLRELEVDNQIYLKGTFTQVNKPLNPYYFDYRKYLSRKQIYHQITVNDQSLFVHSKSNVSLKGFAAKFRNKVHNSLEKQGFKENELAVMNALLLGQRNEVSKELLQSYANAGAIHILALSGLHVGIVLLILNFLFKPIERINYGKSIKLILIVVFLWSFAFIAGMSPSIVRAVTMFTAVAIGWQSKRPTNVYHTLVMSMFVLLLIRPSFLFEVGFQLSYLAVFSIVWLQPKLYRLWIPKWKLPNYFWQLLTVSVAAQFGILPLSLFYFHQFPGLFFLSNLIIIPVLGLILGFGFLIIIFSLFDVLPSFLFKLYNYLIELMNAVVEWIGMQESFLFQEIPFSFLKMFVVYLLIIATVSFLEQMNYKRLVLVLISIITVQGALIFEKNEVLSGNEMVIFHKSRESIIGKKKGVEVTVFHTLDSSIIFNENILKQYRLGLGSVLIVSENKIPKIDIYNENNILVIDSLGLYQMSEFKCSIVLLRQSPKVNLNRMIDILQPKVIVADGSNYKSYVQRWEETCAQKNTPFHYTGRKGAYILKE